MKEMHWYVGYKVLYPGQEILFTGGEFSEVETREEAIQIVIDKQSQFGEVVILEVEHLENPYKKAKKS
ncbi:MAG TPA: hypothetical protein VLJ15_00650 [Gammaproteobacteria bacterium]|nr:hypothetical protein [Gammaproteobacteria bacterium]